MTIDEFFAEAKRLNLRMLGTPEEVRAALDAKDAEIQRLRVDLENTRAEAVLAVAIERERCAAWLRCYDGKETRRSEAIAAGQHWDMAGRA